MTLEPGTQVGPYEVRAPLGRGGMGEVYRARDTKLDRDVALKILPELFADDPDRLMRFEREAKTLATLNHPNIAQIFGLERFASTSTEGVVPPAGMGSDLRQASGRSDPLGARVLVMELVEGEDLSERLARGALALDDAIPIARQIADALEAAHEAGIIHRDLKPANVKVRDDGTVKVLDFGLAKALGPDLPGTSTGQAGGPTTLPTMTSPALTGLGVILGTAAYMSPEQARGKPVDRRSDIWAFGCVLYEMLAGRRPFDGDDMSVVLAAVIKDAPDWTALPPGLPASMHRLLRRCLEKDPRRRLSAIGDARLELEERDVPADSAALPPPSTRSAGRLAAMVAATAVATAMLTWWASATMAPELEPPERLSVLAPADLRLFRDTSNHAISPDGRRLVFLTGLNRSEARLWIRSLDDLTAREVEGSGGAQLPFWSPDSQTVAFFAQGKLMTAAASGGRPQVLADAPDGRGGTWSEAGGIVFAASNAGPLSQVSANGGPVSTVSVLSTDTGETGHRFPTFLPDGRHFLYASLPGVSGQIDIFVGSLDSTDRQHLMRAESTPVFAEPGVLVYSRRGVLVAHPFDASRRAFTGEAVPLGDTPGELNVEYSAGWAASVTANGTLAYLSAVQSRSRLAWLDQSGREVGVVDVPAGPYQSVAVSPDGRRAVVSQLAAPLTSLWWVDAERGGLTPLVNEPGWNDRPVWSGDGRRVAYESDRAGTLDIYARTVDTVDDETLYQSTGLFKHPASWSADSRVLVFTDLSPDTDNDLWTIRLDGDRAAEPFVRTQGAETFGALSPDGRWMAYISDQAGHFDVYVQAYPGPGAPTRVTTAGTSDWGLWWGPDSRQLLILDAEMQLQAVDVAGSPAFSAGPPRTVGRLTFQAAPRTISATADLQRLLAIIPERAVGGRSLTVVRHWQAGLR